MATREYSVTAKPVLKELVEGENLPPRSRAMAAVLKGLPPEAIRPVVFLGDPYGADVLAGIKAETCADELMHDPPELDEIGALVAQIVSESAGKPIEPAPAVEEPVVEWGPPRHAQGNCKYCLEPEPDHAAFEGSLFGLPLFGGHTPQCVRAQTLMYQKKSVPDAPSPLLLARAKQARAKRGQRG